MNLTVIPVGPYCYTRMDGKFASCPYWSMREDKPNQENGHCSYLNIGDWEEKGGGLLWDQIKDCSVNLGDVTPYCGGCGHLYFDEPKVSLEDAEEISKTRRCKYCVEEKSDNF